MTLIATNGFVSTVSAQVPKGTPLPKPTPRGTATVTDIYFVENGHAVTEFDPGSHGGNGYQLNILRTNVNTFEVAQEKYMTTLYAIGNYTSATAAKWGMTFAPNMGQVISSIKLKNNKCGRAGTKAYKLNGNYKLLDQ